MNAKTAEAVARQELEEVKAKLDTLRRMLQGGAGTPPVRGSVGESNVGPAAISAASTAKTPTESRKAVTAIASGGFFSGWGKRAS